MHKKQDENSLMSWLTNFYYYNYNTTTTFPDAVDFLSGTMLTDKMTITLKKTCLTNCRHIYGMLIVELAVMI